MNQTLSVALLGLSLLCWSADGQTKPTEKPLAEIRVVDAASGRGIPLVELESVNSLLFVTDNAGRVALQEPGWMGREIYFSVRSHGYEIKKDGFGYAGARVTPRPGQVAEIRLTRKNLAERLCRLTGEGLYRDSVLLGHPTPLPDPLYPGGVAGQDSVQAIVHRGKVYWFWGDTQRLNYPLGLFRMAGATTPLFDPKQAKSDPAGGIAFRYYVDEKSGFVRAMMPLPERREGVVWVGSLAVVPDEHGQDRLVAHYSRRKGLADEYEQGLAIFDEDKAIFTVLKQLPLEEKWRRPSGHPIRLQEGATQWLLFGSPTPNVRVRASLKDLLNPDSYEAFTCLRAESSSDNPQIDFGKDGKPQWRWQKTLPPLDSRSEHTLVQAKKLSARQARFCPAAATAKGERVVLHSGSVRWNEYRKCWILLAGQLAGKASFLGEVWYAEASHPTGPFSQAVQVVSHDRQTFYNVCHHDFLNREGGRLIHFEGTYTNEFSGNPWKTPRYNYNQILYRLDLADPALQPARGGEASPPR